MTNVPNRPSHDPAAPALTSLFRSVRLEPWGTEYLGSVHDASGFVDPLTDEAEADTNPLNQAALELELPQAEWRPVAGAAGLEPEQVVFLDGVRRVEARLLVEDHALVFGVLGSCAVGAVASRPGGQAAEYVGEPVVQRWCALGGGREDPGALTVEAYGGGQRLRYQVAATAETDKEAPVRLLQAKMRDAERLLAARLLPELGEGLLLCDGPRPLLGADRRVLGYIKTVHAQRLPRPALDVVRALQAGERSPLYLVGSGEGARFEWYLRLRDPGAWAHTLAGSVRLQAHAGPEPRQQLEWARSVADWSCAVLPRFATRSHQDPRAPQQLLPVRAMEQTLRRRLGSAPLLRRRVVAALTRGRVSP